MGSRQQANSLAHHSCLSAWECRRTRETSTNSTPRLRSSNTKSHSPLLDRAVPSPREPVEAMKDLDALRQLLDQCAGHSPLARILDPKPAWRMDSDSWCWQVLYPNTEAEIRMNAPLSRGVHLLRSWSSFVYRARRLADRRDRSQEWRNIAATERKPCIPDEAFAK